MFFYSRLCPQVLKEPQVGNGPVSSVMYISEAVAHLVTAVSLPMIKTLVLGLLLGTLEAISYRCYAGNKQ